MYHTYVIVHIMHPTQYAQNKSLKLVLALWIEQTITANTLRVSSKIFSGSSQELPSGSPDEAPACRLCAPMAPGALAAPHVNKLV